MYTKFRGSVKPSCVVLGSSQLGIAATNAAVLIQIHRVLQTNIISFLIHYVQISLTLFTYAAKGVTGKRINRCCFEYYYSDHPQGTKRTCVFLSSDF